MFVGSLSTLDSFALVQIPSHPRKHSEKIKIKTKDPHHHKCKVLSGHMFKCKRVIVLVQRNSPFEEGCSPTSEFYHVEISPHVCWVSLSLTCHKKMKVNPQPHGSHASLGLYYLVSTGPKCWEICVS